MSLRDIPLCLEKADYTKRGNFVRLKTFSTSVSFETTHIEVAVIFCLQPGTKLSRKTSFNCQSDIFSMWASSLGTFQELRLSGWIILSLIFQLMLVTVCFLLSRGEVIFSFMTFFSDGYIITFKLSFTLYFFLFWSCRSLRSQLHTTCSITFILGKKM